MVTGRVLWTLPTSLLLMCPVPVHLVPGDGSACEEVLLAYLAVSTGPPCQSALDSGRLESSLRCPAKGRY
jgi:hypothetical protein